MIAGTLDITAACPQAWFSKAITPDIILKYIASGVWEEKTGNSADEFPDHDIEFREVPTGTPWYGTRCCSHHAVRWARKPP